MLKKTALALATVAMIGAASPAFAGFGDDGWTSGGDATATHVATTGSAGSSMFVNGDSGSLTILDWLGGDSSADDGFVSGAGSSDTNPAYKPIQGVNGNN